MVADRTFSEFECGKMTYRNKLVVLLSILAIMLATYGVIVSQVDVRDPIQSKLRTEAMNSPIRAGESLRVKITRTKVRGDCPVLSIRKAVDEDGRIYDLPPGVWRGGDPERDYILYDYPIPDNLPPGSYELRVELTYVCAGVEPFRHTQEPVRFRIVE